MKTSVLAVVAFVASFVIASPAALEPRGDCKVTQYPKGAMCCMACGCPSVESMSCRVCLQRCICGDNADNCVISDS